MDTSGRLGRQEEGNEEQKTEVGSQIEEKAAGGLSLVIIRTGELMPNASIKPKSINLKSMSTVPEPEQHTDAHKESGSRKSFDFNSISVDFSVIWMLCWPCSSFEFFHIK